MKLKWLFLLGLLPFYAEAKVKVGKQAPNFTLKNENNQPISLSSLRGNKIALFFYPKNDSYYCTKEACSLRDGSKQLKKANIVILGISYDKPAQNKEFKDKYNLPYNLLSDYKKKISKLYGTDSWWTLGFFPKRKTFLIDEDGFIVAILDNIDVEHHADQIIKAFDKK